MKKTIMLTASEIEKCKSFASEAALTQQAIEFGQHDTKPRSPEESARDILIGKMAEVAVAKMLEKDYGIKVELDFNIYPKGVWDNNDFSINGWSIDVKSTRVGSWFLIEWNKLHFRSVGRDLPDGFISCRSDWDMTADKPKGRVDIEGFVKTQDILNKRVNVAELKKGTKLPNTEKILQADNYGIKISDLPNDWDAIVANELGKTCPFKKTEIYKRKPARWEQEAPEKVKNIEAKYSVLISDSSQLKDDSKIDELLSNGIKLLAFCTKPQKTILLEKRKKYAEAGLLNVYVPCGPIPQLRIIDGNCSQFESELKIISDKTPDFNIEQYRVEHAPENRSLTIEAGAGTGKTTVMVDRILFLMHTVPDLCFEDIAMITFTNEATQNMIHKIEKVLLARYRAVGSAKYFKMLEDVSKIRISTIHSFSKEMIVELGSSVGYGDSFKLKSFTYEKKQLIRHFLNEYFNHENAGPVSKTIGARLHEIETLILEYWKQLDNIGLTDNEIATLDWGEAADQESLSTHNVLRSAFTEIGKRYNELKLEENAIAVEDIIRELRRIFTSETNVAIKGRPIKYLFVDEFQDTDDAQIATVAWLVKTFDLRLFAVGDVKQSIYRFRGAKETAFEHLREMLQNIAGHELDNYALIRNYRTSKDVLGKLHNLFLRHGEKKLLLYREPLIPQKTFPGKFSIHQSRFTKGLPDILEEVLRDALENCKAVACHNKTENDEKQHVTVLSRTNYQIEMIGKLCREKKIPCYIRKEGTLFTSRAVLDFASMIRAYLFPSSAEALFNFLDTPYTPGTFDFEELGRYEPGSKEQIACLREKLAPVGFEKTLKDFRIRPVLAVLREIIDDNEIIERYAADRNNDMHDWAESERTKQIEIDCAQYRADLEQLFIILRGKFSGDMIALSTIFDYVTLNINTNTADDEPDIIGNFGPGCVYGMTVHKAKGLEFDTVIFPFTNRVYRRNFDTEILIDYDEKGKPARVGWCRVIKWTDDYKTACEIKRCNNYYERCARNEESAADREEARLLYVAMTRAIRRLDVIMPPVPKDRTWARFLEV